MMLTKTLIDMKLKIITSVLYLITGDLFTLSQGRKDFLKFLSSTNFISFFRNKMMELKIKVNVNG